MEYDAGGSKHGITTTYNGLGQVLSRTYPREETCGSPSPRTVYWAYDVDGYLSAIYSEAQVFASSVKWDPQGRLTEWTAGNGIKTEVEFDAVTDRYEHFRVRLPGGSLTTHLNYAYDPGDRVIAIDSDLALSMGDPYDRMFYYDSPNRAWQSFLLLPPHSSSQHTPSRHHPSAHSSDLSQVAPK